MIEAALQQEIRARVRLYARQRGIRRVRAGALIGIFRGRAPKESIMQVARAAIVELATGGEVQDPAAPSVLRPQEIVRCEPKSMSLTRSGCARLWSSARGSAPQPWEGRAACVACRDGAINSGFTPSPVAGLAEAVARVCPRCLRSSSRIINGRLCVSCYNRHAEALRGRNARGGRPRLCDVLGHFQVIMATRSGEESVVVDNEITGAHEIIIARAALAQSELCFGWPACGPGDVAEAS